MLVNTRDILASGQAHQAVDALIEGWFDAHEVPFEYRMSVPFMLLFQEKIVDEKNVMVQLSLEIIYNQHLAIGSC